MIFTDFYKVILTDKKTGKQYKYYSYDTDYLDFNENNFDYICQKTKSNAEDVRQRRLFT